VQNSHLLRRTRSGPAPASRNGRTPSRRTQPVERLAIDLRYLQGRSVEEIRKITGERSVIKVRAYRPAKNERSNSPKFRQKRSYERSKIDRLLRSAAQASEEVGSDGVVSIRGLVALWNAAAPKANALTRLLGPRRTVVGGLIVISTVAAVREARQNRNNSRFLLNESLSRIRRSRMSFE